MLPLVMGNKNSGEIVVKTKNAVLGCALALAMGNTQATLYDRGGGLIYDDVLDITWLADDYAAYVNEAGAKTWASNLTISRFPGESLTGWRLPTTLQPDASCDGQDNGISWGHNCTGSEMGHLFYNELGGVAGSSILTTHNANLALFQSFPFGVNLDYWSGTACTPYTTSACYFNFSYGTQLAGFDVYYVFALAVRDGDVLPNDIPEPSTLLLAGLALAGLGIAKRRQKLLT